MLCIANVENLQEEIKFKLIFEIQDASYVSNRILSNSFNPDSGFEFSFHHQKYIGNDADYFQFLTNADAPKHRLIGVDISSKKPRDNIDVIVAVSRPLSVSIKYFSYVQAHD